MDNKFDFKNYIKAPKTLAFAMTYRCTAECANCCFGCSPTNESPVLSYDKMKKYIEEAMQEFDSIKVLVLTGGECMLFFEEVIKTIQFASRKGLITRIVTNGFWATSLQKAKEIIKELRVNGLNEINFSTGDNHQEWVPYDNIVNACSAAMEAGLLTVVSVENHDKSIFNASTFLKDHRLLQYYDKSKYSVPLKVEQSMWMPFNVNEKLSYSNIKLRKDLSNTPCDSIFSTLAINPYSYLLACCGLTCEHILPLRLGNVEKHSIRKLYNSQYEDLIKIWLSLEGPYAIMTYLNKKRSENSAISGHVCHICAEIFKNEENIRCINDNKHEIIQRLIAKTIILNNIL